MTDDTLRAARLRAWAECVQRLIAVAPIDAVVSETGLDGGGIVPTPHSTPPERMALRAAAREVVASWLERDLAALAASAPDEGPRYELRTYPSANPGEGVSTRPAAPALDADGLRRVTARLAAVSHMQGEADECNGDEAVTWCESCWLDAEEFLDPTHSYGIDQEAFAALELAIAEASS